jgi:hypothetical protein
VLSCLWIGAAFPLDDRSGGWDLVLACRRIFSGEQFLLFWIHFLQICFILPLDSASIFENFVSLRETTTECVMRFSCCMPAAWSFARAREWSSEFAMHARCPMAHGRRFCMISFSAGLTGCRCNPSLLHASLCSPRMDCAWVFRMSRLPEVNLVMEPIDRTGGRKLVVQLRKGMRVKRSRIHEQEPEILTHAASSACCRDAQ